MIKGVGSFFWTGGGGGGGNIKKMAQKKKKSARFARKFAISNFSRVARRKNYNCVCLVPFLC